MTELEQAHLTELICLARGRGAADAEIAAALREAADRLATPASIPAPAPKQQDTPHA